MTPEELRAKIKKFLKEIECKSDIDNFNVGHKHMHFDILLEPDTRFSSDLRPKVLDWEPKKDDYVFYVVNDDIDIEGNINVKKRIAQENLEVLSKMEIDVSGKKILDVGFGLGYNTRALRDLGAEVWGCEPKKGDYDFSIVNGNIDIDKAFNCVLQDMDDSLDGTFDIITCFLYCIPYEERDSFFLKILSLLKDDGIAIIACVEHFLAFSDSVNDNSISERCFLFEKHRNLNYLHNYGNRYFFIYSGISDFGEKIRDEYCNQKKGNISK